MCLLLQLQGLLRGKLTNSQDGSAPTTSTAPTSVVQQYMNPYLEASLQPQYDAAIRQANIAQQGLQSNYAKAGAYGGSRQAVAEAELQRGLLDRLADITRQGYSQAYDKAADLFTGERDYGLKSIRSSCQRWRNATCYRSARHTSRYRSVQRRTKVRINSCQHTCSRYYRDCQ